MKNQIRKKVAAARYAAFCDPDMPFSAVVMDRLEKNKHQKQGDAMRFYTKIEVWAASQGMKDWEHALKAWATHKYLWSEINETAFFECSLCAGEVLELLREYDHLPPYHHIRDHNELLIRWIGGFLGFDWRESLDQCILDDEDEAFESAVTFITSMTS